MGPLGLHFQSEAFGEKLLARQWMFFPSPQTRVTRTISRPTGEAEKKHFLFLTWPSSPFRAPSSTTSCIKSFLCPTSASVLERDRLFINLCHWPPLSRHRNRVTDGCVVMGGSSPRTFLSCARYKAGQVFDVPGCGPQGAPNSGGMMGDAKKRKRKKEKK